jgi:hypothetical protein
MEPGKQQEYLNQIVDLIDKQDVYIAIGKTPTDTPCCYNPEGVYLGYKKSYAGIIFINPEKIDINDGFEINSALSHEFVHVQQFRKSKENNSKLDLKQMEYEAYLGSPIPPNFHIDADLLFKNILKSVAFASCKSTE